MCVFVFVCVWVCVWCVLCVCVCVMHAHAYVLIRMLESRLIETETRGRAEICDAIQKEESNEESVETNRLRTLRMEQVKPCDVLSIMFHAATLRIDRMASAVALTSVDARRSDCHCPLYCSRCSLFLSLIQWCQCVTVIMLLTDAAQEFVRYVQKSKNMLFTCKMRSSHFLLSLVLRLFNQSILQSEIKIWRVSDTYQNILG